MPAAVNKNGLVKRDMDLICFAVSHVCSMTYIKLNSRKYQSLQRDAIQHYLAGHKSQKDLIDKLYMLVLKDLLHADKMAKRKRKARLLTRLNKGDARQTH